MSDASTHPRLLELPRDDDGLATTQRARRRIQELLPEFLRTRVAEAGAERLVVTLDGGVESTVAAAMAADALDPEDVFGLVMPVHMSHESAARDAESVASILGIEHRRCHIQPILAAFQDAVGTTTERADDLVALANAQERFRATCAYYVANTRDGLVVSSINRTDRLLGTVTKHGETAADCHLLGDLYRTEVRSLARGLSVPQSIRDESGTRGFETTHRTADRDADELDLDPRTLDRLLRLRIDDGYSSDAVADRLDVDPAVVRRVVDWCRATRHKRHQPPKPSMDS